MRKSDSELGMKGKIKRRDFIEGVGLVSLGLTLPIGCQSSASEIINVPTEEYYPPTKTGLR